MIDWIVGALAVSGRVPLLLALSAAGIVGAGLYLKRARAALYPRMIRLQFAARKELVSLVLGSWGVPGRKRAAKAFLVDCVFGVSVAIFLAMISWAGATHFTDTDKGWLQQIARGRVLCLVAAALMGTFDLLENAGALLMIGGVRRLVPRLTAVSSGLKFVTGSLAVIYPTLIVMCFEVDLLGHGWNELAPLVAPMATSLAATAKSIGPAGVRMLMELLR